MIIGIDASRANKEHKSGTEWYSYYLIRWFAKLDKENEYILYTDRPLTGGLLDLSTTEHYEAQDRFDTIKIDKKGRQELKSPHHNFSGQVLNWPFTYFWTQGRLSLEMLKRRADLLFVPAHALPVIHPRRSIVTIHDIGFELDQKLYGRDQIGPDSKSVRKLLNLLAKVFTGGKYSANSWDYLRWSTDYSIKKASNIITVSEYTRQDILGNYKVESDKITTIYNGYNSYLFGQMKNQDQITDTLIKYGIEQPYFLYVGRIEKKKNIPLLIEALAILKDSRPELRHKLVLVGDASYGYDEVNYMINQFNLVDDVIMPGWIEEDDMPTLYQGASAFVFPSKYEGFGIPLLEAMASNVPIVASQIASIPEVVGKAAWLFDPAYALSIAKAMEKVVSEPECAKQLVTAGREQVKNFSWRKSAEETLALINKVLN